MLEGKTHRRNGGLALGVLCLALVFGACGDDESGSGGGGEVATAAAGTTTATAASGVEEAKKVTASVIAGDRLGKPPTEPNPAAAGKNVWVISAGQSSPTAKAVTAGVETGLKSIGWQYKVCDGKLDPTVTAACWDQAIAADADGIFGVGSDCAVLKSKLEKAKAADIVSIPTYSWDCDETGDGPGLYTAKLSYGDRFENPAAADEQSGEDAAAWIVAQTNGKANVLNFTNQEFFILKFYQAGFARGMEKYCPDDCKVTDVNWLAADFGPKLQATAAAALTREPDANAVQGGINPQLGITQAITAAGREDSIDTIGGLGLGIDADVIREGKGLTATVAQPLEWVGFSAVDTMNSVFNDTPVRDGGVGHVIFDAQTNLPPKGEDWAPATDEIDYRAAFEKSWGK